MRVLRLIAAVSSAVALMVLPGMSLAQPTAPPAPDAATARCAAFGKTDFSGVQDAPTMITGTKLNPAKDDMPAVCVVQAYAAPNIGMELRLPVDSWNGKFTQVTCGGFCGMLLPGCDDLIRRGYACIVTDMGHKSTPLDAKWAYNNLQAEVDFAYRATHVATLSGKAMTTGFYGKPIARSYMLGCSTGGRQGMVEAQRFPKDYDGIVAGAPVIDETGDATALLWAATSLADSKGMPLLSHDELRMLHKAVLARCDMDDGVADGILGDPMACRFDPAEITCKAGKTDTCLTAAQAEAVRRTYRGPHDSKGEPVFTGGPLPGSELMWIGPYVGPAGQTSTYWNFMTDMFGYLSFIPDPGPGWKPTDFDWDRDPARLAMMESLYSGRNPDLRKFKANGGKLIVFQGLADQSVLPRTIIDYYDTAEKTMGGRAPTQEFMRLFLIPGMGHCAGGLAADRVDYLGYLEAWVEQGKAPDMMYAANVKREAGLASNRWGAVTPPPAAMINFSRPLYPYPLQPRYTGKGDNKDAASYRPMAPKAR